MFGKSVNDLGWHEFVRQLSYKSSGTDPICIKLIDIFHQVSYATIAVLKIQL